MGLANPENDTSNILASDNDPSSNRKLDLSFILKDNYQQKNRDLLQKLDDYEMEMDNLKKTVGKLLNLINLITYRKLEHRK